MAASNESVLQTPKNVSDASNCDANFEIPSAFELLSGERELNY